MLYRGRNCRGNVGCEVDTVKKFAFAGLFTPRSCKSADYSSFDPKNFPLNNGFRTYEGLYAEPASNV